MGNRTERLIGLFGKEIDCLLVSSLTNIRYLTGFSGSSGLLLVASDLRILITDFRYEEQVKLQAPEFKTIIAKGKIYEELPALLGSKKLRLGFESNQITYKSFLLLKELLPDTEFVPVEAIIERLSIKKDDEEIRKIKEAADIVDRVFAKIKTKFYPGLTEKEVAAEIEYLIKMEGGEKASFDTIVASGKRSSMPHAFPTDQKISEGELVILDFGAFFEGYASDMTRTVILGEASKEETNIYNIVLEAQEEALKAASAGMTCAQLDSIARSIIEKAGYGNNFGHSLGHGVGLQVHESPRLSSKDETVLEACMVVTIEPGIYISGWGGVRIEDLIVILPNGSENLTASPKGLTF